MPILGPFYIFMHRLVDDNEDNTPFQIYLDLGYEPNSYSAYQPLTRAPCWLEIPPLLWLQALGLFRASPKTYFKSHWPSRSPPPDLSEVLLAQEDDRPRVPDRAEAMRLPIYLLSRNKYFGTFYSVWSSNEPTGRLSKSALTIG